MKPVRKFKLIALVSFALIAVNASAAKAAEGTVVSTGATYFTASQVFTHTFTLPGGRTLSCTAATLSGSVTNGSKTITATPSYTLFCGAKVGATTLPATVDVGTCNYVFSDLTTVASNTYAAKTALACADTITPGPVLDKGGIRIRLYVNSTNHFAGKVLCEYMFDPQSGIPGVHFTDNANNTLSISVTEMSLQLTRVFGTAGNCGEATSTSKYNGSSTATPNTGTLDLDD